MELKKIRMGIVGAGTWGQTHASIYAEHICADPVAICDSREERAREIADKYGIGKVYTDYHSLAADPDGPQSSGFWAATALTLCAGSFRMR